jgi:hypothetical protein
MDKLLYRMFSLSGLNIAVKVFARHDLCCELAPGGRHFDMVLLKDCLAGLAGDFSRAYFPRELLKWVHAGRGEVILYLQAPAFRRLRSWLRLHSMTLKRILGVELIGHLLASLRRIK